METSLMLREEPQHYPGDLTMNWDVNSASAHGYDITSVQLIQSQPQRYFCGTEILLNSGHVQIKHCDCNKLWYHPQLAIQ